MIWILKTLKMLKNMMMTYHKLPDGVVAFSTTRHGGVSQGNYSEFNINPYCGDNLKAVEQNTALLANILFVPAKHIVLPHQTHGLEVRKINDNFFDWEDTERANYLEGVDALITRMPNVCIGVSTADCIPVLLYDSAHRVVAAVHAGWRGTVKRIVQKVVREMQSAFSTQGEVLKAIIGPGISLAHFEVGDEVYEQFEHAGFHMENMAKRFPSPTIARSWKWHLDLWECNKRQLEEMGVLAENIQVSGICTFAHSDDYFSARKLGIHSGRIYTGIMMK